MHYRGVHDTLVGGLGYRMIAVIAHLPVKQGMEIALETAMTSLIAEVRANEPGCRLYTLVKDPAEPAVYTVMELYDDAEAVAAHGASAHFRAAQPQLAACLSGPPTIKRFAVVA